MRKLIKSIILAFLAIPAMAQIPAPQINLGGNIGCQGFPCLNSGTLQFTSDANHTMTAQESSATGGIKVTSTVSLTATRNLILPSGNFQFIAVENATTGGQSIQVIGTSGTGVTIANGSSATVWFDGTNVVQTGSSSSYTLPQATTSVLGGVKPDGTTCTTTAGVLTCVPVANNGPIEGFGTSVTEGVGSFINGQSYMDILATDSANGMQNWGVGGDQAADMVHQVFRKFPQNSNFRPALTILDPFINDANHCGDTTGCLANAAEALNAAIAWTAIPASYRTYATAATNSGFTAVTSQFNDLSMPAIAMLTNTQNATLTFNLTNAGPEIGLTFQACDAYTAATFTVTLGGTLVDTISPIGNDGQTILTQNGASCTLFRKEYANSSGATVSLVIQKTDATTSAAGTVSISAVDTNPAGAGTGAPVVFTEGTIMQQANANAGATAAFDAQANTTATAFKTDGWNSWYVPLRAGQSGANPGVNSTTDMENNPPVNPDDLVGLHPNSGPGGGHFHLAQTIENFALAQGYQFFNVGVSGGHNFFFNPITAFQHYAPANVLGYNNFNADGVASQTALNPGGLATNCYINAGGVTTCTGIDFGYDSSIPAYIGRSFSSTGYYEICGLNGLATGQSGFNCGHDVWWANGDYVKPFGFWRPKGGISYENQGGGTSLPGATNANRSQNVTFINTSGGNAPWMLPLCKSNTYDYQLWYYKDTGDTNTVTFNAYNTADSINGNTSTVTGTITAYSITSNVGTFTATNSLVVGQAVTLSGFGTSTFLNGVNSTITAASGTSFSMAVIHANASATEAGAFGVNASWTGLEGPYSGAVVQCSIGPTGLSTINISQSYAPSGTFTNNDLLAGSAKGTPKDSGIAASNVPLLNASNTFTAAQSMPSITGTGTATFTLGSSSVVGTGATTPVCVSTACDSISGVVSFTTGSGTGAGSPTISVNLPVTRGLNFACIAESQTSAVTVTSCIATGATLAIATSTLPASSPVAFTYFVPGR